MQMLSALLRRYVEGDKEGFRVSLPHHLNKPSRPHDAAVAQGTWQQAVHVPTSAHSVGSTCA